MTPPPDQKTKELPEIGDELTMDRTGEPLQVVQLVGEGGQGRVYRAKLRSGASLALKWYRRTTDTPAQREAIRELANRRCPHPAFFFPFDTVTEDNLAGFGYVMPWMDQRFKSFAQVINDPRPLGLQTKARIGRKLAEAIGALHAGGLCYRDINFGNLCADPIVGDIAVIDNDNVGTDEGHAAVWGVLRFMAPEIIRRERKPSTISDLHSLAVLLFYLLMHGHPLDGTKVEASFSWNPGKHRSEEELAAKHYGHEPLFVFDPNDSSNRPADGTGPANWWPVYPEFVRRLFVQAFTDGLRDATLGGRVLASSWRDAMLRMHDLCTVCTHCGAAIVMDPDVPGRKCWHCGNVPPAQVTLLLRGGRHQVLLRPGATLSSYHVGGDRDYDDVAAIVEEHPRAPHGLVLRNHTELMWTVRPAGEDSKPVEPGQAYGIRAGAISFGPAKGEIVTP